jgi:response regulator RpfG family c-di-GMP phosphodiesterase
VITADSTPQTRRRALSLGAHDFLTKPIDVVETTLRVANLLHTRALHTSLQEHNAHLEQAVRLRTEELERAQHEVTLRLGPGGGVPRRRHRRAHQPGRGPPPPRSAGPSACHRTRSS